MIDSITTTIEKFVNNNFDLLLKKKKEDHLIVHSDFYCVQKKGYIKKSEAESKVNEAMDKASELLASILKSRSIDTWLSIIRRFPNTNLFVESWEFHTTSAVLKFSEKLVDTTYGYVENEELKGMRVNHTEDDFINAFRVAALGSEISHLLSIKRGLSKGAKLYFADGTLRYTCNDEVNEAISFYDRRSEKINSVISYAGINTTELENKGDAFYYSFNNIEEPIPLFVKHRDMTLYMSRILKTNNLVELQKILNHYSEAIEDIFGAHPDCIIAFLGTVSTLCYHTIPKIEYTSEKGTAVSCCMGEDGDIEFFWGLFWKGFLRFHGSKLRDVLQDNFARVNNLPALHSNIGDFFDNFILDENNEIDHITLRPSPMLFKTVGGYYYIDFTHIDNFITYVLESAKEWYGSQNGDRFTLVTKRIIENKLGAKSIVSSKKTYENMEDSSTSEVDLLIFAKNKLWVIENKAFSKTRNLWAGSSTHVKSRNDKIREAVKQAKKACKCIETNLSLFEQEFEISSIEWVVCTPSPEFIKPYNKYGMLADDVPKICTVEELLTIIC